MNYNIAIHAVYRNESKWLREWLEYHLMIGVDYFFLYDNNLDVVEMSKSIVILKPYLRNKQVQLFNWLDETDKFQNNAVKHCLAHSSGAKNFKWLICLDLDEFIFSPTFTNNLYSILEQYEKPHIHGLHVPVETFGSNNLFKSPELQTDAFMYKGKRDCFANFTNKNFYRPNLIEYAKDRSEHQMYDLNFKRDEKGKHLRPNSPIRVNHYATRSFEDWKAKIARGNPIIKSPQEWDLKWYRYNQNECHDNSMKRYLPELKERLGIK